MLTEFKQKEECASVCAANHVTEKLNRLDQHLLEKSLVHDFLEDNTEQPNPILQAKQASVDLKKQELEFLKSTLAASLEEEQKLQQQLETRQTAILQAQEKLQERLSLVTACFEELAR
jgi:vacuolar-type H+-ATPase subunit I/STV1